MIRDITISAKGTGDDQYHEPPARVLSLAVIGGDAHLASYEHGNAERAARPAVTVEVPARSLLLPLTAAIEGDQQTANGDSILRRERRTLSAPPAIARPGRQDEASG